MNIAVLSAGRIPTERAHSIAVTKNANGFRKLGHSADLLTVERYYEAKNKHSIEDVNEYYDIDPSIQIQYFRDSPLFFLKDHKPIGYISSLLRKLSAGRLKYVLDPERRMVDVCANGEYDFCYCRTYRSAYYAIQRGIPTVIESHNPDPTHRELSRVLNLADKSSFRGLVTISEKLIERFVEYGVPAEKTLALQDGVDIERFKSVPDQQAVRRQLSLPTTDDLVVYTGTLYKEKGIAHIIEVAAKMPDVTFVLVGGPDKKRKQWADRVRNDGLDNIRFEGFVPMSTVPTYQSAADILVMPYDTTVEFDVMDIDTTSPLKMFEYLAAARPIISTDIPAISRTIDHGRNGLLASPNDTGEIALLIQRVLDDKEFATELGRNARETAKRYQWKNRCQKIIDEFITAPGGGIE